MRPLTPAATRKLSKPLCVCLWRYVSASAAVMYSLGGSPLGALIPTGGLLLSLPKRNPRRRVMQERRCLTFPLSIIRLPEMTVPWVANGLVYLCFVRHGPRFVPEDASSRIQRGVAHFLGPYSSRVCLNCWGLERYPSSEEERDTK